MTEATAALRHEPLRLTVSVTPTFAAKWLIPRLPDLTRAHPDIELRILASEAISNFQSDGVDLAVRQSRRPSFGPGLVADLLLEQEVVAVGSPVLLGDRAGALSYGDIGDFTLLDDAHDLWSEFIEKALGRTDVGAVRRVGFNQTSLVIDAAVAAQGLAVASRFLVQQDIEAGRLVQAFMATMRGGWDSYVVTARKPRYPEQTRAVSQWLLSHRQCSEE